MPFAIQLRGLSSVVRSEQGAVLLLETNSRAREEVQQKQQEEINRQND